LLQIGRVQHFAPAVGEGRLRRRFKKLPSEHQQAVIEESLVNRGKGSFVKTMAKVESFHLSSDRASESPDRDLCLHSLPHTSHAFYNASSPSSALASFKSTVSKPSVNQL